MNYLEQNKQLLKNPSISLVEGDCLSNMKLLPDSSINMILTDPPYGIDFCSHWTDRSEHLQNDKLEDWQNIMPRFFVEAKRVLKDDGILCCFCGGGGGKAPVTALLTIEAIKYFNLVQTLVWSKFLGLGWRYRSAYENILILSHKDDFAFYDTSNACSNVIMGINQHIPNCKEHPTQKPVVLMEKLLKIHTRENDVVLDPFAGSGTTGIACANLNRNCILMELETTYCSMIEKRFGLYQRTLFTI